MIRSYGPGHVVASNNRQFSSLIRLGLSYKWLKKPTLKAEADFEYQELKIQVFD
jgi:hypothetical protein